MDILLPTEPKNYYALIKQSLKLYRASFTHVILLALLLSITAFIPRIISDIIDQDLFSNLPLISPHRLWLVVVNLSSLMFFIALFWRMYCVVRGEHEPFIQDFSVGIRKLFYVIVATILQGALLVTVTLLIAGTLVLLHEHQLISFNIERPFGSFILMIVAILQSIIIIYLYTLFYFYIPIIAIENKGILASLKRSAFLVWNHWWRTFSLQISPWFYYLLLLILIKYVLNIDIHIYYIPDVSHSLWISALHIVIFTLFIPWVAALLLVQLKDLELRKHITGIK